MAAAKEKLPPEQLAEAAQAFVKEFGAPQSLVDISEKSGHSCRSPHSFFMAIIAIVITLIGSGRRVEGSFLVAAFCLEDCIGEAEKSSWSLALAAEFKRASPSKARHQGTPPLQIGV